MSYLMNCESLREKLFDEKLVLLDVRSNLQRPDDGYHAFMEEHIVGAHYLHLDKDLSGQLEKHGGNHPLPDEKVFTEKLRELGINNDSVIVIYDDGNEMFAPRAWFLLHYFGLEEVYVLEGGFRAWKSERYPVTAEVKSATKGDFTPHLREGMIVSMEEVRDRNQAKDVLLDARAKDRYLGKVEPLYNKAGHIPGAKSYFWGDVLDEKGEWKSKEDLQAHFHALEGYENIIVSCGSGISACPNILALKEAGFDHVQLYAGSFSDWISYEENEVETQES